MQDLQAAFESLPFALSRTVSWIHIGDTHLTRPGEQNEIDLGRIVDEINAIYANGGVDFVYVPGDIADDGSSAAYELFRSHLDRLKLPWFGIVGDHDVHEKSFSNFQRYIASQLYSAFSIGDYRFLRLNAFSIPRPDAFLFDQAQLAWLEAELKQCQANGAQAILFLHCYPSDLKHGGHELAALLQQCPVLLVDMGHTHYNEISNDGDVLYTATRSTGQIEEGPVGYSVTTLDHNRVSWHFVELGSPSLISITSPSDERLTTSRTGCEDHSSSLTIRAKIWSLNPVQSAMAQIAGHTVPLHPEDGALWSGTMEIAGLEDGSHALEVIAIIPDARTTTSSIRIHKGRLNAPPREEVDQQNAIGEWKERGILGTQLGPNKNGRKW
jgi:3',5'-cyclic AMP phosphodiesterase CpdA